MGFSSTFHCQDEGVKRLYVAKLTAYTSSYMARMENRQKVEAETAVARQRAEVEAAQAAQTEVWK